MNAIAVYAAWHSRLEAGETIEFETLLRSHPDLSRELEELHASWKRMADVGDPSSEDRAPDVPSERLSRLGARESRFERYQIEGEVARGGMGAILRVWDEDLRRHLAMKVSLPKAGSPRALARFLEEAQVTGQLDHPGIVPVHELGLDSNGRLYFTMKLVEGRDLKRVFQLVDDGEEGWNPTRALGVILKVCEAMAYAHKKGVIHRDLKPSNVMVGSFGEVFVMDWGLARDLRRQDARGAAPRDGAREDHLATMDGDVLGTPAYMPPEQARGAIDELSPRSDVYSIGAMLYHLLARRMPYVEPGERPGHRELLARVIAGPPAPLHALNADLPAELAAICEKAMARDPARRYPDTLAFAEDLRAYLEGRVVAAYETGAVAELRKWIARNRALAAACAAAIAFLAVGLVVSSSLFVKARAETERADGKAKEAEQRAEDVLSLSAMQDLQELVARADSLWPAIPANAPRFEEWLRDADALIEGRKGDPDRGIKGRPGLVDHRRKLAELETRPASDEVRWWRAQLSQLIADLDAFSHPETGLSSAGASPDHGWGMKQRLRSARTIEARSNGLPEASRRWAEAIASIGDPSECPAYGGLALAPQLGLLPIGTDAASGLWEFAHLETGEPPERAPDGSILMREETGLVLVLIPGGTFRMGAQSEEPGGANYDPRATADESPVHEVTLDPFFLSKYEMTQGQWLRFVGTNPSVYGIGTNPGNHVTSLLHPVEQVSPRRFGAILARLDLVLPTEAQWEYAARAGTSTPWWTGEEKETLEGAVNLRDGYFAVHVPTSSAAEPWLDDGYSVHAPVGGFRPNGFGLFDVHGNAFEACRDGRSSYNYPVQPGEGERRPEYKANAVIRGGSYFHVATMARSAARVDVMPDYHDFTLGVRPARRIR